jgi:predicted DNA-binding antitoxin AbrB/MazE fold protein
MTRTITAVYENGLLRPLEPLDIAEREEVRITVQNGEGDDWVDHEAEALAKRESHGAPSLEEVRLELSRLPGSWADDLIADRGEY